jgi:hypothetical protein
VCFRAASPLLDAISIWNVWKQIGIEVDAEGFKYMFVSRHLTAELICTTRIVNEAFKNIWKCKYVGTAENSKLYAQRY